MISMVFALYRNGLKLFDPQQRSNTTNY